MSRQDQLQFCKVCVNQQKDLNLGIICSLNGQIASFEGQCADYQNDSSLKARTGGKGWSNGVDAYVASQGQRFANYLIDFICMLFFIVIFSFFLGMVLAVLTPSSLYIFEQGNKFLEYLIGFVAGTIYYATLEGISGQSIGKVLTKTKVVTEEGGKPDFGTILLRTVCRYIPFDAFSFLSSEPIGWHDSISKTRVVPTEFKVEE